MAGVAGRRCRMDSFPVNVLCRPYALMTGIFLCLYPSQRGSVRLYGVSDESWRSSMADAHLTSAPSDQAVFMIARPKGMPETRLTPAGIVIIG